MKKKLLVMAALLFSMVLLSYPGTPVYNTKNTVKEYYHEQFMLLSQKLRDLKTAVEQDDKEHVLQAKFLQARIIYKQLELFVAYYLELEAPKFNGPAIDFIEEEDPDAHMEPQGFQVIETYLYPHYDRLNKVVLLQYVDKLLTLSNGIGQNANLFNPDNFLLDATTEELYRMISLGITGFDSPVAQLSVREAAAALTTIKFVIATYRQEMNKTNSRGYESMQLLLTQAQEYARRHADFNHFNRMEFIIRFINPVCSWLSNAKEKMGNNENRNRYALIKKTGNLFDYKSLRLDRFMGDDTMTDAKIALGKKLCYEPLLAVNGKRSCAGCHRPEKAFTDGLTTARGLDEHSNLPRNTPTLWNAALQKNLFYDSRQTALDHLITEVLSNEKEMNSGAEKAVEKLIRKSEYARLYKYAYPAADTLIAGKNVVNAIAMYLRTLVSYNARFDKYMRGEKNKMSSAEIKGFNVFMGKAKCGTCHYAPLFNGSKPPTYYYQESEVLGVPVSTDKLHPQPDSDPGRSRYIKRNFLNQAFKTPTLRNIALTAPYMHNGIYKTLGEVIDFYDNGGGRGLGLKTPNQTLPADKLLLSTAEKKQLEAFMHTLTDTTGTALKP